MTSRNTVLIAMLAAMATPMAPTSWGQTNNSASDAVSPANIQQASGENDSSPEQDSASSGELVQRPDRESMKDSKRDRLRNVVRPYVIYPAANRYGRTYYSRFGGTPYNFGGGLQSGYYLGSRWVNPNYGNHGNLQSGYNLGPVRINPNYGNSW